ncbi:unnamed protein product, partial [Iphiclides podalirius]
MKRWLSALCHVVLLLMMTNAITIIRIPKPSPLSGVPLEPKPQSNLEKLDNPISGLKKNPASDKDIILNDSAIPSTLRTVIMPAYVSLHATGKLSLGERKTTDVVGSNATNPSAISSSQIHEGAEEVSSTDIVEYSTTSAPSSNGFPTGETVSCFK